MASDASDRDRIRLLHMLEAAEQVQAFAQGRVRADLDTDAMLRRAVVHALQEIGEAASKISPEGREGFSSVPWSKIVGMRHRLVHEYFQINLDLVWRVVEQELPLLIAELRPRLRRGETEGE